MNTIFSLLALASLCCIPIFLLLGLVNIIQKKSSKKRFKLAGISALALIVSFIGFGFTTKEAPNENALDSVALAENTPTEPAEESTPTEPSTPEPTEASTPGSTEASTPESTEASTPESTEASTPESTEASTPESTEASTPESTEASTPESTEASTPESTEASAPESTAASAPESTKASAPESTAASTPESTEASAPESTETPTPQPTTNPDKEPSTTDTAKTDSNTGNNLNIYDNPEQQEVTDTYVLNTSRMKIHYPNCSSVPKISPKNYSTSSESIDELKTRGYTTCGNCF